MNLAALCQRRSMLLIALAAIQSAGVNCALSHTNPTIFFAKLAAEQPNSILITSESLDDPNILVDIRRTVPNAQLILCLLPDAVNSIDSFWAVLDDLGIDTLCQLDELTNCLITLETGHFYKSALLATHPIYHKKETLPGWNEVKPAEKRILSLLLKGLTGPAIADKLCISRHTLRNEKAIISQTLGVSGGPGSLINFVLINAEKIRRLLAE
jgi:DNA-binding NarL/FixJ family response regulator